MANQDFPIKNPGRCPSKCHLVVVLVVKLKTVNKISKKNLEWDGVEEHGKEPVEADR